MEALDQELLDLALEALAKNKDRVDNITTDLSSLLADLDKHKAVYTKDKKSLDARLGKFTDSFKKELADTLKAIPIPEDGIDGKDGVDGINGVDGKDGIDGRPGRDGKDGSTGDQGPIGKTGIQGPTGDTGPEGKAGKQGKDGKDGVGIEKFTTKNSILKIHLTNGSTKEIELPKLGAPTGVTAVPTEITVMRNLADTDVDNAVDGQVLTKRNGKWVAETIDIPQAAPGDAGALEARTELESLFKMASSTAYKELTYDQGNITNVDIYTSASKTTKLFSKIIGYNNGNITSITITDEVNGGTLNKILAYSDGNLANISSTYTV